MKIEIDYNGAFAVCNIELMEEPGKIVNFNDADTKSQTYALSAFLYKCLCHTSVLLNPDVAVGKVLVINITIHKRWLSVLLDGTAYDVHATVSYQNIVIEEPSAVLCLDKVAMLDVVRFLKLIFTNMQSLC